MSLRNTHLVELDGLVLSVVVAPVAVGVLALPIEDPAEEVSLVHVPAGVLGGREGVGGGMIRATKRGVDGVGMFGKN